jgi:hypothetical protein
VPTTLSSTSIDEALQTLRHVIELMRSAGEQRPLGLAINRVTPGRLSAGERDGLEILKTLPIFNARLSSRRVFADLKGLGHLHLHPEQEVERDAERLPEANQHGRGRHHLVHLAFADRLRRDARAHAIRQRLHG